jgi:hypothetical protein
LNKTDYKPDKQGVVGSGMPMPAFTLFLETGAWRSGELVM